MVDPDAIFSALREVGPWLLSFIALVQMWVVKAVEKLRRGKIEIFESKAIQVGHGALGPSLALLGTLRAVGKEVFVRDMHAVVERKRDHARLTLTWWAFRSPASGRLNLEPVYGFLASPAQPFRYDLFLVDSDFAESRGKLEGLGRRWIDFVRARIAHLPAEQGVDPSTILNNPALSETLFSEFLREPEAMDVFQGFDGRTYWEVGEYAVALIVVDADARRFRKSWTFRLGAEDAKRLRSNAAGAIREVCGLLPGYASAYAQYEPPDNSALQLTWPSRALGPRS
jgi:hypothetical protein